MKKLSLYKDDKNYSRNVGILNKIIEAEWWLNPILNPEVGTVEPAPKYQGMRAYADGTNWNPAGSGEGIYLWNGTSWRLLVPHVTLSGITLDNGVADTPGFVCNDSVNNTHAYFDVAVEHARIVTSYRGGGGVVPFKISAQNGEVTADGCLIKDGGVAAITDQGGGAVLKVKVIEIGDWDMSTATGSTVIDVAHGLTRTKIRTVAAMVRNDADTTHYPFAPAYMAPSAINTSDIHAIIRYVDGTNVRLETKTGGIFDAVVFDDTSYNRGWITIFYV